MGLTDKDLKNIGILVKVTIEEDETLVRKDDIKHLPTKDEFYSKMGEVVGELKAIRIDLRVGKTEEALHINPSVS